jgi:hypothetical protein
MHVVPVTDALVTRLGEVHRRQQNLLACQLRRPCQRITVGVDDDRSLNPVDPALVAVAITRGDEHAVDRRIRLNAYDFSWALGFRSWAIGPIDRGAEQLRTRQCR